MELRKTDVVEIYSKIRNASVVWCAFDYLPVCFEETSKSVALIPLKHFRHDPALAVA
jgi:hypothetical protein